MQHTRSSCPELNSYPRCPEFGTVSIVEKKPELIPFEPLDQPNGNTDKNNLRGNSTA